MAACADSCITSPSLPVNVSRPLPCISSGFGRKHLAADFGPGQTRGQPDLIFLLRQDVAVFQDAEVFVDVCRG